MRICDDVYIGSDITRLTIRLRTTGNTFAINLVKPDMPSYTVGELKRSNRTELIFDDRRDLDTFIDALLHLQKYHRESVGKWRIVE